MAWHFMCVYVCVCVCVCACVRFILWGEVCVAGVSGGWGRLIEWGMYPKGTIKESAVGWEVDGCSSFGFSKHEWHAHREPSATDHPRTKAL